MQQFKDLILETKKVDWQSLVDLQPNNLKTPYFFETLKKSLIKNGFAFSFYAWHNPETGENLVCDGHSRLDALRELKNDGYNIPDQLSCTFLDLPDRKTAVKYLLEVFNTKKNPIDEATMIDWIKEEDIELEEVNLEWLDVGIANEEVEELEAKEGDFDATPPEEPKTVLGDLYEIGEHRLLCGDSTDSDTVAKLMGSEKADLAHNDPPYGMKKEKDGVLNDNLNFDDLLQFNHDWISLQFTYLKDNGSFYCWGTDEPLMDIYSNILKPYIKTQKATFRNLITWDKGNGQGQNAEEFRMYPIADEKCLFVMCGVQGFNNNADNYFEGWEGIRTWLISEYKKMDMTRKQVNDLLGSSPKSAGGLVSHYFDFAQWSFIPEHQYKKLQSYCQQNNIDAFKKEYDELKKEYDELKKEYYNTRAYFNNTHDNQNNVWHFERTSNKEREGTGEHATPKPISLCERAIKSSCPDNGLVLDFFLGSGSTMVASHQLKRKCYGMELDPKYTDVCVLRMLKLDRSLKIIKNGVDETSEWLNILDNKK